jgi:hypothetical protein
VQETGWRVRRTAGRQKVMRVLSLAARPVRHAVVLCGLPMMRVFGVGGEGRRARAGIWQLPAAQVCMTLRYVKASARCQPHGSGAGSTGIMPSERPPTPGAPWAP